MGGWLADIVTPGGLAALAQVVMIDLMLAGDNVIVLGALAAGLPPRDRRRVLGFGVGIALAGLVGFALIATRLLRVVGLLFAGGVMLLWVAAKLWRDLRRDEVARAVSANGDDRAPPRAKTMLAAALQVAVADLSMSLDNVLAVAGAARAHPAVLLIGLSLSVTLMALAANLIARLIERHHWLAYFGLIVIVYVAGSMIYSGWVDPVIGIGRLIG